MRKRDYVIRLMSIPAIMKAFDCYRGIAIMIKLIATDPDVPDVFKSVRDMCRNSYGRQMLHDKRMAAFDELLEGFGVEAIRMENYHVDNYWYGTIGLYVNMGDTYNTTIIYDVVNREFIVSNWGDFLETMESQLSE